MDEKIPNDDGRVHVSMELTGSYDDIVPRLDTLDTGTDDLTSVTVDLPTLLDTVVQLWRRHPDRNRPGTTGRDGGELRRRPSWRRFRFWNGTTR